MKAQDNIKPIAKDGEVVEKNEYQVAIDTMRNTSSLFMKLLKEYYNISDEEFESYKKKLDTPFKVTIK